MVAKTRTAGVMPQRAQLKTLLHAIDEGFCLAEIIRDGRGRAIDYRFLEVNRQFEAMTGLRDAAGRRALELLPDLEAHWPETYGRVAAGETMRFEAGSEAMGRFFDVFAAPVTPEGRFVLVFRDITERRREAREREEAREQAERLLAEVNHRVMNTLAMITAIVRLETQQIGPDGGPGAEALARLQGRLNAVSVLYRALNRAAVVSEVRATSYLDEIARAVGGSLSDAAQVRIACDVADVVLPTAQAAPLALLVNELMTNALKYAFPDGRTGCITVSLQPEAEGLLRLEVADDGIGIAGAPAGVESGIGGPLVEAFAEQIGGSISRSSGAGGTRVTVVFPAGPATQPLAASASAESVPLRPQSAACISLNRLAVRANSKAPSPSM